MESVMGPLIHPGIHQRREWVSTGVSQEVSIVVYNPASQILLTTKRTVKNSAGTFTPVLYSIHTFLGLLFL